MTTMESHSRVLAATRSCSTCPINCYFHPFDRFADRASPDNTVTLQARMEISPPPLFLYQSTAFSWPYSLGTLPIQTQTQMSWRVLEPNQSIVSIARPRIKLENLPPPIRPTSSATTTRKMPAYNSYAPYISPPTMQLSQSTAGEGLCACTKTIRLSQEHEFRPWGFGVARSPRLANVQRKSSVLVGQSPISPPTCLHTTATTIPLQQLDQPITWTRDDLANQIWHSLAAVVRDKSSPRRRWPVAA